MMRRILSALIVAGLFASGCSGGETPTSQPSSLSSGSHQAAASAAPSATPTTGDRPAVKTCELLNLKEAKDITSLELVELKTFQAQDGPFYARGSICSYQLIESKIVFEISVYYEHAVEDYGHRINKSPTMWSQQPELGSEARAFLFQGGTSILLNMANGYEIVIENGTGHPVSNLVMHALAKHIAEQLASK